MIPTPFHPSALPWLNRYATLGHPHAHHQPGQALPDPQWVATSDAAAADLGWPADWWTQPGALDAFSAGAPWPGMLPAATVYSGHQFGVWAGQLGDGRALLLGEVDGPHGPRELQLKGSGMTPYSRRADGRAVLRSSIREFLCSEAMHALGIPTTRALALVASDLPVRRETVETAAVVTRTAPSFLRFGHAEHFCHHAQHGGRGDFSALRRLIDFVIDHHYPQCRDAAQPVAALLAEVAHRTAEMIAGWQAVGFCHGVMNTDNLSLLGLTIDYGPFGFLDGFDPMHICNHSDDQGRYAYARQPQVAYWNLHALAQALVPLIEGDDEQVKDMLTEALSHYPDTFARHLSQRMRAKLGFTTEQDGDQALTDDLMRLMARHRVDYTLTWRLLGEHRIGVVGAEPVRDLFLDGEGFDAWVVRYDARLRAEHSVDAERTARMHAVNPKYILRNHLAELAIRQAEAGDYTEVQRLHQVLARPFDEQPEHGTYAALPPEWAGSLEISCSS